VRESRSLGTHNNPVMSITCTLITFHCRKQHQQHSFTRPLQQSRIETGHGTLGNTPSSLQLTTSVSLYDSIRVLLSNLFTTTRKQMRSNARNFLYHISSPLLNTDIYGQRTHSILFGASNVIPIDVQLSRDPHKRMSYITANSVKDGLDRHHRLREYFTQLYHSLVQAHQHPSTVLIRTLADTPHTTPITCNQCQRPSKTAQH